MEADCLVNQMREFISCIAGPSWLIMGPRLINVSFMIIRFFCGFSDDDFEF